MSHKYPASWKNCSTCSFWGGVRTTDYFAQWVEIEKYNADGKCMCRRSGWYNRDRGANMSCQSYDKWAPLKK